MTIRRILTDTSKNEALDECDACAQEIEWRIHDLQLALKAVHELSEMVMDSDRAPIAGSVTKRLRKIWENRVKKDNDYDASI